MGHSPSEQSWQRRYAKLSDKVKDEQSKDVRIQALVEERDRIKADLASARNDLVEDAERDDRLANLIHRTGADEDKIAILRAEAHEMRSRIMRSRENAADLDRRLSDAIHNGDKIVEKLTIARDERDSALANNRELCAELHSFTMVRGPLNSLAMRVEEEAGSVLRHLRRPLKGTETEKAKNYHKTFKRMERVLTALYEAARRAKLGEDPTAEPAPEPTAEPGE